MVSTGIVEVGAKLSVAVDSCELLWSVVCVEGT